MPRYRIEPKEQILRQKEQREGGPVLVRSSMRSQLFPQRLSQQLVNVRHRLYAWVDLNLGVIIVDKVKRRAPPPQAGCNQRQQNHSGKQQHLLSLRRVDRYLSQPRLKWLRPFILLASGCHDEIPVDKSQSLAFELAAVTAFCLDSGALRGYTGALGKLKS